MRRRLGITCMLAGLALLLAAMSLFLFNRQEAEAAGRAADAMLEQLQAAMGASPTAAADPQQEDGPEAGVLRQRATHNASAEEVQAGEMAALEIDSYLLIGYLSLPSLQLELPVMSGWDTERLKLAPCRQFGSVAGRDLVIAAHNYRKHFGRLQELAPGDRIQFTDLDGQTTAYLVQSTELLQPTDVEDVKNSIHDLVLYTCTYGGRERIVVGCDTENG